MTSKKTLYIVQAAIIAAIYITLLYILKPITYGEIQFRIPEALTILPYFTPAAIPGVTIGCFLGSYVTGAPAIDYVFGSLATLLAAVFSYLLRKHKFLVPIPPIVVNAIVVPWILRYAYKIPGSIPFFMFTVGGGQIISCGILGLTLLFALEKQKFIFRSN
jgi:uncharacterized membrane protein